MTRPRGTDLHRDLATPIQLSLNAALAEDIIRLNAPLSEAKRDEAAKRPTWLVAGRASSTALNRKGFRIAADAWKKATSRLKVMPKLYREHDTSRAIGKITKLTATDDGLLFEGLVLNADAGQDLEDGLLDQVSVGMMPSFEEGGIVMQKVGEKEILTVMDLDLLEVTLTGIPADTDTGIDVVKRLSAHVTKEPALTAPAKKPEGNTMDLLKLLIGVLKLSADATETSVIQAVMALLARLDTAQSELNALATSLSCEPNLDAIKLALAEARSPKNFIERAKYEELLEKYQELRALERVRGTGKNVPEALKPLAIKLAMADTDKGEATEEFKAFMASLQDVPTQRLTGADGSLNPNPASNGGTMRITQQDREAMGLLGVFTDEKEMNKFADIKPHEALKFMFPNETFTETKEDRMALLVRQAREQ